MLKGGGLRFFNLTECSSVKKQTQNPKPHNFLKNIKETHACMEEQQNGKNTKQLLQSALDMYGGRLILLFSEIFAKT